MSNNDIMYFNSTKHKITCRTNKYKWTPKEAKFIFFTIIWSNMIYYAQEYTQEGPIHSFGSFLYNVMKIYYGTFYISHIN